MDDFEGALCVGRAELFDPDCHEHLYLGSINACWICEEARELCFLCPVYGECFKKARETRESHMIMAGYLWTNGRPRDVRKRK